MSMNRYLLALYCCSSLLGCGSGGSPAPEPVVRQDPAPNSQDPQSAAENPTPDPQTPRIGGQEPLPNAQDPLPPSGGEAGASPNDR